MSDAQHPPAHHAAPSAEPSDNRLLVSAVAWIGVMLIFAVIVVIAYVYNREPVSAVAEGADERYAIKEQRLAEQQRIIESYAWIDQNAGQLRIPVERAMALTLAELRAERADQSAAQQASAPAPAAPQAEAPAAAVGVDQGSASSAAETVYTADSTEDERA